ncbi:hypothetical protein N7499_003282 [Penicillium canescens]|uniref:uncharacterized protein n=1 Tax=Penicillium canescens TaxID=5083 RepID=UPI0026DF9B45|nr:uncharacterized protein N7446_014051 [Penicillium canescens]KAJ6018520.1 hypothetical protein N7522_001984 [Penicillium canescens]KAJ6039303.1 hypothetical protein N7446_014051 [Penicillium canescens]KAJ6091131.1 hypothetical protein N7499_003282 [Penicillium canescens]KAJ6174685.1 hypothetical protein N7485_005129 [Penicillium canescens]
MAMTSLHVAVLRQATGIVETIEIVLQDMKESQKLIYIDQPDELDNTALSYAISTASTPIVHTLVRAGRRAFGRVRVATAFESIPQEWLHHEEVAESDFAARLSGVVPGES